MKKNDAHARLEDLLNQATLLSDEEIESIMPGSGGEAQIAQLASLDKFQHHPLSLAGGFDFNAPDLSLLRVMRNPDFFSFTCKHLFCKPDGSGQPLEIMPFQAVVLKELWQNQFPILMASRGASKSFLMALYALLRMTFVPGTKAIVVASGFRQSKIVFGYAAKIWAVSPFFRDLVSGSKRENGVESGPRYSPDKCSMVIGNGSELIAIPIGDGEKVRGLRATVTLCDEFNSVSPEVFQKVIGGFGVVSADPVANVKSNKKKAVLQKLKYWSPEMEEDFAKNRKSNQSIISGTAGYSFETLAKYYNDYKAIIDTRGDEVKLAELMGGTIEEGFDWKQYAIIRLPYTAIPKGYMDAGTISRAKQMNSSSLFKMEYLACFANDSDGFFKKTLIETCVVGPNNPDPEKIIKPSCGDKPIEFIPTLKGQSDRKYIYGIDPASERDNFALVILEIWPDHRRIVHLWTTRKNDHRAKVKRNLTNDHDYFKYCARKIRDLMKVFPCDRIMIDAGGGGTSIREALRDPDKLKDGELPILEIMQEGEEKPDDVLTGLHILEMVQFSNAVWIAEANNGLKKDMEDRALLFPLVDCITLGLAYEKDVEEGRILTDDGGYTELADTLETCNMEMDKLKEELTSIVVSITPNGRQRWDTPGRKKEGQSGAMRKDRYSALLIANMGARLDSRIVAEPKYNGAEGGGFARGKSYGPKVNGPAFRAPMLQNSPDAQAYFAAMYGG